ncbi:unnamed protein product [Schistosoma haematobium]|nr:unnamed protein product [Schistosoma haematobium]
MVENGNQLSSSPQVIAWFLQIGTVHYSHVVTWIPTVSHDVDFPTSYCLVGLLQEKHLYLSGLSIGSNDSWLFIATPESITGIEKNHGNSVSADISVVQVASDGQNVYCLKAGNWHSVCLTDTGDVYTWGWNEHGQLGHRSLGISNKSNSITEKERESCVSVLALPTPVDFPDNLSISQIACGGCHTACLTEDGILFCFGCNKFGQLGFDSSMEAVDSPVKHPLLTNQQLDSNMVISSVYCGLWSTTLYLNSKT